MLEPSSCGFPLVDGQTSRIKIKIAHRYSRKVQCVLFRFHVIENNKTMHECELEGKKIMHGF